MSRIRAYYSLHYTAQGHPRFARLGDSARLIQAHRLGELVAPRPRAVEALPGLHDADYLRDFMTGQEPLASSQGIAWSPAVRDAALAMLDGQLEAVEYALRHGIAANLARGFHHAVPERGTALCPLNGLALTAHVMPDKRIAVLDCDEHGGNGTEAFSACLPNLYNISLFGTRFGCYGGPRSWALAATQGDHGSYDYAGALQLAVAIIDELAPDLLVYQAGADCHADDPKGRTGLSTTAMFRRDLFVFRMARQRGLPTAFLLAGGYQAASKTARLNLNTVRAAVIAWQLEQAHPDRYP